MSCRGLNTTAKRPHGTAAARACFIVEYGRTEPHNWNPPSSKATLNNFIVGGFNVIFAIVIVLFFYSINSVVVVVRCRCRWAICRQIFDFFVPRHHARSYIPQYSLFLAPLRGISDSNDTHVTISGTQIHSLPIFPLHSCSSWLICITTIAFVMVHARPWGSRLFHEVKHVVCGVSTQ